MMLGLLPAARVTETKRRARVFIERHASSSLLTGNAWRFFCAYFGRGMVVITP